MKLVQIANSYASKANLEFQVQRSVEFSLDSAMLIGMEVMILIIFNFS